MKTKQCRIKMFCPLTVLFFGVTLLNVTPLSASTPSESHVLEVLATKAIDPALGEMAETALQLSQASEALCRDKEEASLSKARDAWREAYLSWRRSSPFLIGPAAELSLPKRIGGWRANDTLYTAITSSDDFHYMRDNIELRGYAAAEYILFSASDPVSTATDIRCGHLLDVTREIAELTASANSRWHKEFREGFVNAGNGQPFLIPGDALSPVVAQVLNTTEVLLRDYIGSPSNFFEKKTKPELLEAWHSNTTGAALLAAVKGIAQALEGDEPAGILTLVATKDGAANKKDPALAKSIGKQLEKIEKTITELNNKHPNIHAELANNKSTLKPLYKQLQKLQDNIAKSALVLELDVRAGLEAQLSRQ